MNKLIIALVLAAFCFNASSVLGAATADMSVQSALSDAEESDLIFMREEEKLARDTYITLGEWWGSKVFSNISKSEQSHMDALLTLINAYGLEDPVVTDEVGVFTNDKLSAMYVDLVDNGKLSLLDAMFVGALIEEVDIEDLHVAISETEHPDIVAVYENLLAGSENHLRAFVRQIESLGATYSAQVLEQSEVDEILGIASKGKFRINAGLNDAWYYPETDGQGFFITVFPDIGMVSLAWFTYDTRYPSAGETADLGDPGHRWLTALGAIDGNQVEMNINITSGGLFDTPTEVKNTDPEGSDGTITLTFDGCNSGTVEYDITSINRQGIVPIERVVGDNIALCEALNTD